MLLCNVEQLMRHQPTSFAGSRRVAAVGECEMIAHRVCHGVDGARRFRRERIGMHAHVAEVVAKARLEERSRVSIERLTGRTQNLIHDRRGFVGYGSPRSFALNGFLFPAIRAVTRSATITLSIQAGVNPDP